MNITKNIKSDKKHHNKCSSCSPNSRTLCCKQVIDTTPFKSTHIKREFNIFPNINGKSKWIFYLLECNLRKIQYVRKSKGLFNICLNNHKDVKDANAIETYMHFTLLSYNIFVEQLTNGANLSVKIFKEKFGKYLDKKSKDPNS